MLPQQEREVEREEAGHQAAADGAPEGLHHPDRQGSQPGPEPVAAGPRTRPAPGTRPGASGAMPAAARTSRSSSPTAESTRAGSLIASTVPAT